MYTWVHNKGTWPSGLMIAACLLATLQPSTAQDWVKTGAPGLHWVSLVCSSNANHLVALPSSKTPLPIYLSTNSGASWFTNSLPNDVWGAAAMSADGQIIKASVASYYGKTVWTTTNGGVSWWSNSAPISGPLACSADGIRWVMSGRNSMIYTSTNLGESWISNSIPGSILVTVASSADGDRLVAAGSTLPSSSAGPVFTSTDAGTTWQSNNAPLRAWTSVASSADGNTLVAVANYTAYDPSAICVSTNAGADWTLASAPANWWTSVAISTDGSRVLAAPSYGTTPQLKSTVYHSTNSGYAWYPGGLPHWYWHCAASSADGSKLAAASGTGSGAGIYTWQAAPTLDARPSGGFINISWASLSATVGYTLEANGDLQNDNWSPVNAAVADDGTNRTVTFPVSSGNGFYRLKR